MTPHLFSSGVCQISVHLRRDKKGDVSCTWRAGRNILPLKQILVPGCPSACRVEMDASHFFFVCPASSWPLQGTMHGGRVGIAKSLSFSLSVSLYVCLYLFLSLSFSLSLSLALARNRSYGLYAHVLTVSYGLGIRLQSSGLRGLP